MNDVLCDLEDVKIFVDDILIYGQGDTMEDDENLAISQNRK